MLAVTIALAAGCAMPEAEYVSLLTRADSLMTVHQDSLRAVFDLGGYAHFDYDEGTGIFVLSDSGVAKVLADVQFVGEVSRLDSTWTWAWEVPVFSGRLSTSATSARWYGWRHGIRRLRSSGWHADATDGWEMTSLTGLIAGAEGAYRAPSSDSTKYTFMLLRNVRWAPPGRTVDSFLTSEHASASLRPNQRMHQSGRGRRLASCWHGQSLPGRFPELAAAPQVMRGR